MFKNRIKKFYRSRSILRDMALRQLKAKYAGSKLGLWWAVVVPLILALSVNFIFMRVFKITFYKYGLFVLSGIIPWLFSNNALSESTNSFIENASLSKQNIFLHEFIPVSSILANLLNFLIGLLFLLPVFIISNPKIVVLLPFLLVVITLHFLFLVGLGILFSSINVFFRDLSHFLSIAFMLWFWVTPVFYSLDMLTYPFSLVCLLNPMTYYIVLYQGVLFLGKTPSLFNLTSALVISVVFLFIGYSFFLNKEPELLKRI